MSFFFSSRRRHTRLQGDWSSDVCSSDLDLADRIANSLAEKRPGVVPDLNAALELVTKLNAATYAYCAYLVIQHGANHSAVARSFLSQAARTWHRKEKQLRRCLRVIAGIRNRLQNSGTGAPRA